MILTPEQYRCLAKNLRDQIDSKYAAYHADLTDATDRQKRLDELTALAISHAPTADPKRLFGMWSSQKETMRAWIRQFPHPPFVSPTQWLWFGDLLFMSFLGLQMAGQWHRRVPVICGWESAHHHFMGLFDSTLAQELPLLIKEWMCQRK